MADEYVRFTVKVLPPQSSPAQEGNDDLRALKLAIAARPTEIFGELLSRLQKRYNARYHRDDERETHIGQLQDSSRADIFEEDTIGSLYGVTAADERHLIYARLSTPNADLSATAIAALAAPGVKRRVGDEGSAKQGNVKSRKAQYGEPRVTDIGHSSNRRVDEDGFKIPKKVGTRGGADTEELASTILVQDSQPAPDAKGSHSTASRSQQRSGLNTSSPASHWSPVVSAVSRNASNGRMDGKSGISSKLLPTPESRERQRSEAREHMMGQPTLGGQPVFPWFQRRTSATANSEPRLNVQEDPIEDLASFSENTESLLRAPSSSQLGDSHGNDQTSRGVDNERLSMSDVNRSSHLRGTADSSLRTPSLQPSLSNRTAHSSRQSAPGSIRNSMHSTAHGWTKQEDDLLIQGLSAKSRQPVMQILKDANINRTASAARSRYRLLTKNQTGPPNTLYFPSSSLAIPQSQSDREPAVPLPKPAAKKWDQAEIGTLRKAIADGLDAHEIQAKLFSSRSQESVSRKMRDVLGSVHKLHRRTDSFPKDAVPNQTWKVQHSFKLRRAYREGLDVVAAASRYFKGVPAHLIEQNMNAYRRQMEDLSFARSQNEAREGVSADEDRIVPHVDVTADNEDDVRDDRAARSQSDEDGYDGPEERIGRGPAELNSIDSGDADGLVIQDSYDTASVAPITSSPPLLREAELRASPEVVIPPWEQQAAQAEQLRNVINQHEQLSLLRRSISSGTQTQLNFKRDKGKGAVRPAVNVLELDRQYGEPAPHFAARRSQRPADEHNVVEISSDEDESEASEKLSEEEQHLAQLPAKRFSSTVKKKHPHSVSDTSSSADADVDDALTTSSGEPNAQLAFELEQSMSAAEPSIQSQAVSVPDARMASQASQTTARLPAYVQTPSSRWGLTVSKVQKAQWDQSEDEKNAFQTQDPSTTHSQRRKMKIAARASPEAVPSTRGRSQAPSSDDESNAFQTQKPTTTPSKNAKAKRKDRLACRTAPLLDVAVHHMNGLQKSLADAESTPPSNVLCASKRESGLKAAKARRSVYDVGISQGTIGPQSQRSGQPQLKSSGERRGPGLLPRFYGAASKLAQRKKDAEAKAAARKAEQAARTASWSSQSWQRSPLEHTSEMSGRNEPTTTIKCFADNVQHASAQQGSEHPGEPRVTERSPEYSPQRSRDVNGQAHLSYSQDTTSQSQTHVKPTVELPYPQTLSRSGHDGKLEVGRPGFTFHVPRDCVYLRSDEIVFAAAAEEASGERDVRRRAEDYKLQDQQAIAMCCNDSDMLKRLHKIERRHRRERRLEDGQPPSRGPVQRSCGRGVPKPIEWDVNVMPDSDDSMSSRGRDEMTVDEDVEEMEEGRNEELDRDENPAYFDRDRHFSEVEEDESDEKRSGRVNHLLDDVRPHDELEPNQRTDEDMQSDAASDETPLADLLDLEAMESGGDEDNGVTSMGAENDVGDEMLKTASAGAFSPDEIGSSEECGTDGHGSHHDNDRIANSYDAGVVDALNNTRAAVKNNESLPATGASEGDEGEDDNYLPTAPPPPLSDEDEGETAVVPSDRDLQDLVQSGEAEVAREQSAPAFTDTRLSPGLGSSPIDDSGIFPQQGAPNEHFHNTTNSFSPIDARRSDEDSPQHYQRPSASPGVSASMLPPFPSSGKVRSSLDQSPTPAQSREQLVPSEGRVGGKKRKRDDVDELAGSEEARRERKKQRRKDKRAGQKDHQSASNEHVESIKCRGSNGLRSAKSSEAEQVPTPTTSFFRLMEATSDQPSKKAKKKQKKAQVYSEPAASSQQVRQNDRLKMPPPSVPPHHIKIRQQTSLPSPSSESSAKDSKAAKKAAKRARREIRRRSSLSASRNDSIKSDTSLPHPVASSPPALPVASSVNEIPAPPLLEASKPVHEKTAGNTSGVTSTHPTTEASTRPPAPDRATNVIDKPTGPSKQRVSTTAPAKNGVPSPEGQKATGSSRKTGAAKSQPHNVQAKPTPIEQTPSRRSYPKPPPPPPPTAPGATSSLVPSSGLKDLMLGAHIPAAPKLRPPQAGRAPVSAFLFGDDDDDEDSTDSSEDGGS